jgi:hypothetical protein
MATTVLKPDHKNAPSLSMVSKMGLISYRSQGNIPLLETISISFL